MLKQKLELTACFCALRIMVVFTNPGQAICILMSVLISCRDTPARPIPTSKECYCCSHVSCNSSA